MNRHGSVKGRLRQQYCMRWNINAINLTIIFTKHSTKKLANL